MENMLERAKKVEDIADGSSCVDCYVSTDSAELTEVLEGLGFVNTIGERDREDSLSRAYENADIWCYVDALKHGRTGLRIDLADVPLEEAERNGRHIEFVPMSKFRVYDPGKNGSKVMIGKIIKALDSESQNMAFVNDRGTRAFVKLAKSYEESLARTHHFDKN